MWSSLPATTPPPRGASSLAAASQARRAWTSLVASPAAAPLVSRLPLPVWLLALALLAAVAQRLAAARGAGAGDGGPLRRGGRLRQPLVADDTICVVLVGTEAHALRLLAAAFRSAATVPSAVSVALVVVVRSAAQVARETAVESAGARAADAGTTQTWLYAARPRGALNLGRREAMRTLYNHERYVLFAHGCRPMQGWDALCVQLLRDGEAAAEAEAEEEASAARRSRSRAHKREAASAWRAGTGAGTGEGAGEGAGAGAGAGVVLTAFPSGTGAVGGKRWDADEEGDGGGDGGGDDAGLALHEPRALFPRLRVIDGSVRIEAQPMAVPSPTLVASTAWSRAFSFCSRRTYAACANDFWHDGQLEQTAAFARRGVRVLLPATAVCTRASRMGVGAPTAAAGGARVALDDPAFGAYPLAGLVRAYDTEEAILKFGSVDVARVLVREQEDAAAA